MGHLQTGNKQEKNTSKQEKNTSKQEKKTPPNKKKNTSKQEKTPTNKKKTPANKKKTPPNKKNTFRARETPFKQGVSSDQMQKLTNGRSFRSRQGGGNQGEREAAMAWGWPRWSSVSVPLWR
jgi:hypothetical protein